MEVSQPICDKNAQERVPLWPTTVGIYYTRYTATPHLLKITHSWVVAFIYILLKYSTVVHISKIAPDQ